MLWTVLVVLSVIFAILFMIGAVYRRMSGTCTCQDRLDGKTVIVTGASAGIGKETAKDIADRGAKVILACRNVDKAEKVKEWIVSETGNQNVVVRQVDLSDFDSVRKFAKNILETEKRLDILINNAGAVFRRRETSKQGYEMTTATNHHGPFLLTILLLGLLRKSCPSRIINVSSRAHNRYCLDFDDFHYKKRKYSGLASYSQSKLCNILFTKELSHMLIGKGVTVNSLHPGVVETEIVVKERSVIGYLILMLTHFSGKTAVQGAQTTIHLAVSDKVSKVTGEYFVDCEIADSSKKSHDPGLGKKLWEITEEEVGLKPEERHFLD